MNAVSTPSFMLFPSSFDGPENEALIPTRISVSVIPRTDGADAAAAAAGAAAVTGAALRACAFFHRGTANTPAATSAAVAAIPPAIHRPARRFARGRWSSRRVETLIGALDVRFESELVGDDRPAATARSAQWRPYSVAYGISAVASSPMFAKRCSGSFCKHRPMAAMM